MACFQTWTKGIMTSIWRSCLHVLVMTSGPPSAPPWLNPAPFGSPPVTVRRAVDEAFKHMSMSPSDFRGPWNRPVEKRKTVEARRDLRLLVDDISFHFKFETWLFCARWAPPIRRVITPATRPIYFRPFKGGVIERGPPCATVHNFGFCTRKPKQNWPTIEHDCYAMS